MGSTENIDLTGPGPGRPGEADWEANDSEALLTTRGLIVDEMRAVLSTLFVTSSDGFQGEGPLPLG